MKATPQIVQSLASAFLLALLPLAQAATVTINPSVPAGTSQLKLGDTQTQVYWEKGNATAVARAKGLLSPVLSIHNQSIMGWGAGPVLQTSPGGPINFSGIDARVSLMQSLGGELALTLCTAPGWMKTTGQDWAMEDRVADEHVGDFAALCQAIAQRYPQVHYFDIWNEMKGYWNSSLRNSDGSYGNWDYVRYTALYNAVYTAIKSVRPDAEVGGFYLPVRGDASNTRGYSGGGTETPLTTKDLDCLNYWLTHKAGADFISMDRWLGSGTSHILSEADQLALTWTYKQVLQAIRAKTSLPLWYAEYYTTSYNPPCNQFIACVEASMYYWMIQGAGNSPLTALLWSPVQGTQSDVSQVHGLLTSTADSNGGKPTAHYAVFQYFHDYFGPGTPLCQATSSDAHIEVLASALKTLLINKYNTNHTVSVNGANYTLPAYGVELIDTPPAPALAPVAWYKADAITGLANRARLGTWIDSNGNGNPATNSFGPQQPVYVTGAMNGLPVVRFNGVNNNWLAFARPVQDDFTIMCVFQSSQGIGTGTFFWQGAGLVSGEVNGATNDFGTCLNANGQILAGTGKPVPPENTVVSGAGFNGGAPHLVTFTRSRTTGALALYVDGTLVGTGSGSTNSLTAPTRLVLGAQQTLTNGFTGDIAEVKIFNSVLPNADRQQVESALATKYGIDARFVTNLPPTVALSFPTNNSALVQPHALTLLVAAADADGTIARVDFLSGTNLLGSVTNAPYSLAWTNIVPGHYWLRGRAIDDQGALNYSPAVNIFVQPLTLTVLSGQQANGQFGLQFQGQNDQHYILETSIDLASWLPVLTNTPINGMSTFIDTNATAPKRFYRVRQ